VYVHRVLSACTRCPAITVTLETGGADTYTQRAIPDLSPAGIRALSVGCGSALRLLSVAAAKKPKGRELYIREHEYNNQVSSIRAPIERAVAHLKTWKILFVDYRRPLSTFLDSFRAVIGLYFFELSF
jgi:DDE superfamily endonuclease